MVQRSIFPIFSHILLFLTLFTVERVSPSQVVLFDSSNTHTELNWDTWYNGKYFPTGDTSNMERSMWYEETWSGFDDQSNVRVYGICPTNESPSNESTYLFLPVVQVKQAKGVFVHLTYTVLPCGPDKISCRETVHIHAKEFSGARDHENYDIRYFDPSRPDFLNEWKRVKVLTVSNGPDTVSFPLQLRQDTSHIRLAIDDNRACASILIAKVYYTVCDEYTKDFAKYESTISSGDPIDNIMVKGKCVNNAVETNNAAPVAFCGSTGSWTKHVIGSCECLPGFRNSSDKSCQACPVNTYKSDRGSQECRKCPSNSEAYRHGSAHCTCRTGYYRAPGESVELGCTQPPASPTGIEVKQFNQTDVELKWNEPSTLGGRPEIWYEWQCARGDCSGVKAYPADKRLSSRVIRLSSLKSNSDYVFNIFAKNKVSEVAGASTVSYRAVDVRTISIDMYAITGLRVESEMRGGVQLAWDSPNVNNNIGPFEIEISIPHLGGIETRTSHSPSFTMSNINDGMTYYFRVRAHVDRWGEWSKPLRYEAGHALIHTGLTHPVESQDFFITPWMLGLIVLLLLVLLSCVFLLCRIKTKNRKQMSDLDVLDTYKQDTMTPDYSSAHRQFSDVFRGPKLNAPLITYGAQSIPPPYYGSSPASKFKPYVDPSAYEDPNQALIEFASDIDPSSVFITQVIGGGEFGDVCMGGLKKIHGEVETVAIKTLKPGSTCKAKADFLLEASIMGQFAHPNVVRLIGVVTKSEPSMIVTEYMENGSLDHYLRSRDANGEDFGWTRLVDMLRGIAAGMKYLTDKGYVHRDLAARNVLVDSKLNCKIADFGLSRGVDDTAEAEYTTNGGKIPIRWTSPEAITHRKFTAASDVWSFGVLTWEVCSYGERPYWDWTNHKVISEIMAGYRLPAPMDCPASLHRLMLWCWKLERHERPSFAQLLSILEKYTRSPERIFLDSTLPRLNKDSVNTVTLRSNMCPPSPSGSPPVYPPLEDFLQSIGVGHTITKLNSSGVYTVVELSRMNHIDLLSRGLITEEYQRISQALSKLLKKSVTSLTTTPVHSRTLPRPQEGFFV